MFNFNDISITSQEVEKRKRYFEDLASRYGWYNKRVAFCSHDTVEWLCLVLFFREKNISLAPIHGDMLKSAAIEKALTMKCQFLLWRSTDDITELGGEDEGSQSGLLQFSSGTTGRPKLIQRSWESIALEIENYNKSLRDKEAFVPIVACPVTHSYGLISGFLSALSRGIAPHVVTGLNPKYVIDVAQCYAHPLVYSSPQMLYTITTILSPLHKLYAVMTSGTVMPSAWFDALKGKTQYLLQQYGCSEAGCISIAHEPQFANELGKPLEHFNVQSGLLETPSEIIVSGDGEKILTQDLGYFGDSGHLFFFSRQDDTIIISGFNVYPAEVEDVLLKHPDIEDIVVFKLDSDKGASKVAALYTSSRELDKREIRRWCHQSLAPYQWPTLVERVDKIPRLANGKISRRKVAEDFIEKRLNTANAEAVVEVV